MDDTTNGGPIPISEAWRRLITGISGNDIAWLIITVLLVSSVYYIAVLRKTRTKFTKRTVLWWIFVVLGWIYAFFVFGRFRIFGSNDAAPGLFFAVSFATCVISISLFNNNKIWYWIISNTVMGIIIFGMAFTFAIGVQSYSYAILFGSLIGIFIARLWTSIKYLNKKVVFEHDDEDEDEEESLLDHKGPKGI